MSAVIKDRVKVIAANKPTAGSSFTVGSASSTNMQSFADAYSSGTEEIPCFAVSDTAWMSFYGTFTTGSLAIDALIDSSTGSLIDWSGGGDVTILVTPSSKELNSLHAASQTYISGLEVVWNSTTAITVKKGAAFVEESDKVIELSSDQSISPSLSASSWHYIYLKSDGTCEVSTTAPIVYTGTAKSKNSAGNKWRCLGQIRTNSSSQILKFAFEPKIGQWTYLNAIDTSTYRVLSTGKATTSATITLSSLVPQGCQMVFTRFFNSDSSGFATIGAESVVYGSTGFTSIPPNVLAFFSFPCNESQQMFYSYASTPTGGLNVDVGGYIIGR